MNKSWNEYNCLREKRNEEVIFLNIYSLENFADDDIFELLEDDFYGNYDDMYWQDINYNDLDKDDLLQWCLDKHDNIIIPKGSFLINAGGGNTLPTVVFISKDGKHSLRAEDWNCIEPIKVKLANDDDVKVLIDSIEK